MCCFCHAITPLLPLQSNYARFINHSCKPNAELQRWSVAGFTRIGIFAKEDGDPSGCGRGRGGIAVGEEISYDYQFFTAEKTVCNCGAGAACRGLLSANLAATESAAAAAAAAAVRGGRRSSGSSKGAKAAAGAVVMKPSTSAKKRASSVAGSAEKEGGSGITSSGGGSGARNFNKGGDTSGMLSPAHVNFNLDISSAGGISQSSSAAPVSRGKGRGRKSSAATAVAGIAAYEPLSASSLVGPPTAAFAPEEAAAAPAMVSYTTQAAGFASFEAAPASAVPTVGAPVSTVSGSSQY